MDPLADNIPLVPNTRQRRQGHNIAHQTFTFPTLQVNRSIASLASSESTTNMTRNKALGHQTQSSLEDSTYEVLGDSAILSDVETDDGNTASLTSQSVDGRTPDDVSSLADTEDLHEDVEEQFENVSRQDAASEDQSHVDLEESVYPSSDEDEQVDHGKNFGVPRQAERKVDESELTARPESPDVDIAMSPSLQHLRRQPLTDSELFEHHNLPQPRALTVDDAKRLVLNAPQMLYHETREIFCDVVVAVKHLGKTVKLTYQANTQDRKSLAFYSTTAAQVFIGLSLLSLVAWLSAHMTITFHTKTPAITTPVPSVMPATMSQRTQPDSSITELSRRTEVVAEALASSSSPKPKETIIETGLGAPMQTIPVNESADFVAHILGDNHFILTPPKQFLQQRKQPNLHVNVIRAGETLPTTVSKYDGVYAVEIDRDQAWGVMDIMLYTKCKPKITQQFQLNFGNPWLKLNVWQASAEKLSRGLRDEWTNVNDFVSHAIKQARKEYKDFRTQLNADNDKRATDFATRATAITKDVSRIVAEHSKALSSHLASMQYNVTKDMTKNASKLTKEISKFCSTVSSVDPYVVVRDVQEFHAQVVARAQTNAANIVKKLQRAKTDRKAEKKSKAAEKAKGRYDRKVQRKMKNAEKVKDSWKAFKKQEKAARKASKERAR